MVNLVNVVNYKLKKNKRKSGKSKVYKFQGYEVEGEESISGFSYLSKIEMGSFILDDYLIGKVFLDDYI